MICKDCGQCSDRAICGSCWEKRADDAQSDSETARQSNVA